MFPHNHRESRKIPSLLRLGNVRNHCISLKNPNRNMVHSPFMLFDEDLDMLAVFLINDVDDLAGHTHA